MTRHGQPLSVDVVDGELVIRIGVDALAHAVVFADWANPFDERAQAYLRTFAITDSEQLAADVRLAMLAEREDGSSPLTDFLDEATKAAIEDGSVACCEDEHRIRYGETAPCEFAWVTRLQEDR